MKNEFEVLCESINTTLKQTKVLRYPKQIQFSEEFTKALAKEVARHMQVIDESQQPIRDLPEKFLKALKFELVELTEKRIKRPHVTDMRPRQKWNRSPVTQVLRGKKDVYDRAKEDRSWKKES